MLIAAAFVPAAPLLVPRVAAGAAGELEGLRGAAIAALDAVLDADADEILLIGVAPRTGAYPDDAVASFAGFGLPLPDQAFGHDAEALPSALSVGRWLLDEAIAEQLSRTGAVPEGAASRPRVQPFGVRLDDPPVRCADLGRVLAERSAAVAVVVVGDGSARRGVKAPGAFDERAEAFDERWLDAMATADLEALAALDAEQAFDLMVGGRAPWQVAAAMAGVGGVDGAAPPPWSADVLATDDRYGVMYAVATWVRSPSDEPVGEQADEPADETSHA